MSERFEMNPDLSVEVVCACGRNAIIGETKQGKQVVIHAEPVCTDFLDRDPLDYVIWIRRRAEGGVN